MSPNLTIPKLPVDAQNSPDNVLGQPAREVLRSVAGDMLHAVARARQRLGSTADEVAVHDFRVALRRLRSWERAFRPQLEPGIPRKLRRRLKWLAKAADPSRDAVVHLNWVRGELPSVMSGECPGVEEIIESLEHARRTADAELLETVDRDFAAAYRRARRVLRTPSSGRVARDAASFAQVVVPHIIEGTEAVRSKLLAVHTVADRHEVHVARIASKRLRYVLEPVARYHPGADLIVARLKTLQDAAGELHDAYSLADVVVATSRPVAATYAKRLTVAVVRGDPVGAARLQRHNPVPGVLALAARLRERQRRAFDTLRDEWLGGAADAVLNHARTVANEIWLEYCSDL